MSSLYKDIKSLVGAAINSVNVKLENLKKKFSEEKLGINSFDDICNGKCKFNNNDLTDFAQLIYTKEMLELFKKESFSKSREFFNIKFVEIYRCFCFSDDENVRRIYQTIAEICRFEKDKSYVLETVVIGSGRSEKLRTLEQKKRMVIKFMFPDEVKNDDSEYFKRQWNDFISNVKEFLKDWKL